MAVVVAEESGVSSLNLKMIFGGRMQEMECGPKKTASRNSNAFSGEVMIVAVLEENHAYLSKRAASGDDALAGSPHWTQRRAQW